MTEGSVIPGTRASSVRGWREKIRRTSWWWGSAVFAFVATLIPYWLWNIIGSGREWRALWRIPLAPNAVFDSYLYFQQMNLLQLGVDAGTFSWFAWPLRAMMWLLPHASTPEIWVIGRWLMTVLLLWTGAWCIRRFTGADRNGSRWLILCFWLSFLIVIGLRPGVFSLYLPFGFLGIGLLGLAYEAAERRQWLKSFLLAVLTLAVMKIYPWFLIYAFFFIAALFTLKFAISHRRRFIALSIIAAIVACAPGILLAAGVWTFNVPVSFAAYDRNGITLSHAPLISNTVIAIVTWIGLLFAAHRHRVSEQRAVMLLAYSWIVLFVLWFSPLMLGVEYLIDHFIIIVVMLSWITTAFFLLRPAPQPMAVVSKCALRVAFALCAFASLFFIYQLQQAVRNPGKFEPYAIHLSIWLSLAMAAWFHVWSIRGASIQRWWRRVRIPLLLACALIGSFGLGVVIRRNMADMPGLAASQPVMEWMNANIPPQESVCADPTSAKVYASHVPRFIYPQDSNLMLQETDEEQHRRLEIIGAAYETEAAGDDHLFPYLINGVRQQSCDQARRVVDVLERLGWSHDEVNRFIGCREKFIQANIEEVMSVIHAGDVDAEAFRSLCPWVVIPDEHREDWHLPGSYEEIRVDGNTSVWHVQ